MNKKYFDKFQYKIGYNGKIFWHVPYNHFSKEKTEKQAELLFVTFRQI